MSTHAAAAEAAERRTSASSTQVLAIALGGAAASIFAVWPVWSSPLISHSEATAIVRGLLVASYVGVGVYTWWTRPTSRLGLLIAGAGFLFACTSLMAIDRPLPYTFGRVTLAVVVVYLAYLLVSFPRERPSSPLERRFVTAAVGVSVAVWAVVLVFARMLPHAGPLSDCTNRCPDNGLQLVATPHEVATAISFVANALTALIVLALAVLLSRKARSAALLRRRAVAPLLWASVIFATTYATYSLVSQASDHPPDVEMRVVATIGAFGIPVALLFGQLRGRAFAAASLWRTIGRMGAHRVTPAWLQAFLGETLGDPLFELAVWDPSRQGYVDVQGTPLELPEPSATRSVTRIARTGAPSLALIHDATLDEDPELLNGLGSTADMLLENSALVGELRASRTRIVESAEQERHRLERNLHDGAQQRLTSMQIKLALAREHVPEGELGTELDELATEAARAAAELRALAHGIYPALLYDAGLAPALRSLASSAAIPIRVFDRGVGRAAAGTELAIYFCVLEALQNVGKHAGKGARATVMLAREGREIEFEVRDDGVGFDPAAHADGIGLVSMRDRIGAVGGRLEIRSSPGAGAAVRGSVPVDDEGSESDRAP